MPVQYPCHLYIRIDRELRAGLLSASEAAGVSTSALARTLLRTALVDGTLPQRIAGAAAGPLLSDSGAA